MKDLTIRLITDDDMPIVAGWFTARKWTIPPNGKNLPESGYVAEKNGKLLAVAWLYITNSEVGIIDWIATNPDSMVEGLISVTKLISYIEELSAGRISVFMHFTPNEKFSAFLKKKCGFKIAEKDVNICVRRRPVLEVVNGG